MVPRIRISPISPVPVVLGLNLSLDSHFQMTRVPACPPFFSGDAVLWVIRVVSFNLASGSGINSAKIRNIDKVLP